MNKLVHISTVLEEILKDIADDHDSKEQQPPSQQRAEVSCDCL